VRASPLPHQRLDSRRNSPRGVKEIKVSTQIRGTGIRKVNAAMVTDDGQNMLLRLQPHAGPELVLALPAGQLNNLILLAAQGASDSRRKREVDPGLKEAFVVEDWEIHLEPEDRVLVLSLTLAGDAELSFRLPIGIQQPMIDKLAATVAPPPADPSQPN
jgi:hypothetical protein